MINTKKANARGKELVWVSCSGNAPLRLMLGWSVTDSSPVWVSVSITTINCLLGSCLEKTCTVIPQSRRLSLFWGSLEWAWSLRPASALTSALRLSSPGAFCARWYLHVPSPAGLNAAILPVCHGAWHLALMRKLLDKQSHQRPRRTLKCHQFDFKWGWCHFFFVTSAKRKDCLVDWGVSHICGC